MKIWKSFTKKGQKKRDKELYTQVEGGEDKDPDTKHFEMKHQQPKQREVPGEPMAGTREAQMKREDKEKKMGGEREGCTWRVKQ